MAALPTLLSVDRGPPSKTSHPGGLVLPESQNTFLKVETQVPASQPLWTQVPARAQPGLCRGPFPAAQVPGSRVSLPLPGWPPPGTAQHPCTPIRCSSGPVQAWRPARMVNTSCQQERASTARLARRRCQLTRARSRQLGSSLEAAPLSGCPWTVSTRGTGVLAWPWCPY